jgi:Flp pilus assembly protein TadG
MEGQNQETGQSLLELAIVLPLLVLIVLGALDLGRAFFTVIVITNASREGARYLVQHPAESTVGYIGTIAAARAEATGSFVVINNGDVTPVCDDADANGCDSGGTAIVTVNNDFFPILGWFIPSPLPLSRTTEMLVP